MCSRKTYSENDDDEEEDVGDVVELEIQVLGDEGERRVFGGADFIACKLVDGVAVLIAFAVG